MSKKNEQREERLYSIFENNQGCKMQVIKYDGVRNVTVKFLDEHQYECDTKWQHVKDGNIINPFAPTVIGIGIVGTEYNIKNESNNKNIREYVVWKAMLERCFDNKKKEENPAYQDVTCCKEWLYFPNFYKWLHSQENFDKWTGKCKEFNIDKDIIKKGNKIYSPENCCLVPWYVNAIFVKDQEHRGDLPIGLSYSGMHNQVRVRCHNPLTKKSDYLGTFYDIIDGFNEYKKHKEYLIKEVARLEYSKGNITKRCYDAMMAYEVEITD
jgi:hypothetical protein